MDSWWAPLFSEDLDRVLWRCGLDVGLVLDLGRWCLERKFLLTERECERDRQRELLLPRLS